MFKLKFSDEAYPYEIYHLVKAFFPGEEVLQEVDPSFESLMEIERDGEEILVLQKEDLALCPDKRQKKLEASRRLYRILEKEAGRPLAWGILMGIRPTKLFMGALEEGRSDSDKIGRASCRERV